MSEPLKYIGLARKAGSIELGETNSGAVVRAGKAKLLIVAADSSDNAKSKAENFVYGRKTPLVSVPFTKEQISETTGVNGCSMAAFTDIGLASAFLSQLAESDPSYTSVAQQLAEKNEKAKKRKREAAAHERNKKIGKPTDTGKRRNKV